MDNNENALYLVNEISNHVNFDKIKFPFLKWHYRYNTSIDNLKYKIENFRLINEFKYKTDIKYTENELFKKAVKNPLCFYCKKENINLFNSQPITLIGSFFENNYEGFYCNNDNLVVDLHKNENNLLVREDGKYIYSSNIKKGYGTGIIEFVDLVDEIITYFFILIHSYSKSKYFSFKNIKESANEFDNKYYQGRFVARKIISLLESGSFFRNDKVNLYEMSLFFNKDLNLYEIKPIFYTILD